MLSASQLWIVLETYSDSPDTVSSPYGTEEAEEESNHQLYRLPRPTGQTHGAAPDCPASSVEDVSSEY